MNDRSMKYTLFQAENGRWGTKTASGKIHDRPEYERCVKDDGSEVFYNGLDTVCSFSEDDGMELIAFCEPWWYVVFSLARFPNEYDTYLEKHFCNPEEAYPQIIKSVDGIIAGFSLTEIQLHILNGIKQFIECELNYADPMDDHDEEVYREWIESSPTELSNQDCVNAVVQIMQSPEVAEIDKEHLWFGLFCFIDFIAAMGPIK